MQKNNKATQFKSIANGLADLYEKKNSDYGDEKAGNAVLLVFTVN